MSTQPKRSGRGTHGSLTKAGKVRDQVMRNRGLNIGGMQEHFKRRREERRKTTPRGSNRSKYTRRVASGVIKPLDVDHPVRDKNRRLGDGDRRTRHRTRRRNNRR